MSTTMQDAPAIRPAAVYDSWRQASITGLSADEIAERLGFAPNMEDDPDKVVSCWGFAVGAAKCAVWDYRGSHLMDPPRYSAFGPMETLAAIFGNHVAKD